MSAGFPLNLEEADAAAAYRDALELNVLEDHGAPVSLCGYLLRSW